MISCVMCTYNGEKYIAQQLTSIKEQTVSVDELIIYDDISTDGTLEQIRGWINDNDVSFKIKIIQNVNRYGACKNFERALKESKGDYIFFSDQDDVWMRDKIEISLKKIKESEVVNGRLRPCLVHTDLYVTDEDLNIMAYSFLKSQGLKHVDEKNKQIKTLLVQNFVTGCTVVINKALKELATPFPDNIIMHDYWLALVACLSGEIGFVDRPTIKYRQHSNNTVGAFEYMSLKTLKKMCNMSILLENIKKCIDQNYELRNYRDGCFKENKFLDEYCSIIDNKSYIKALLCGYNKQGYMRNALFHILLSYYLLNNN